MGQGVFGVVRAPSSWLDRKLAAADSVFSLQSGDGRSGFECPAGSSLTLLEMAGI